MLPVLVLLCLADLAYSAYQHYHSRLDGDIAAIVVPSTSYQQVLKDPFGVAALTEGQRYSGSNRFFAHYVMKVYVSEAPAFFGRFTDKVDALYWSSAAFKTVVQLLLLLMLALYAHSMVPLQSGSYIALLLLLTPFFQVMGYAHVLGIINASLTYTFFYSWPVVLLLLFYYPFFKSFMRGEPPQISLLGKLGLGLLVIILPFSGPVSSPVILIITLLYGLSMLQRVSGRRSAQGIGLVQRFREQVHPPTLVFFSVISLLALYSMYLGQFNIENTAHSLPLGERYVRMLEGLGSMLTIKLGYPVLLGGLLISGLLFRSIKAEGTERIRVLFKWALVFFVLYILLLPLGGYRSYRPLIVRNDTLLPVISGLIVLYSSLAFYLLRHLPLFQKKVYALLLLAVVIIFTAADGMNFEQNASERAGLQTLKESQAEVVELPKDQLVLSWYNLENPALSHWNAILLQRLGITDTLRLYYNREE